MALAPPLKPKPRLHNLLGRLAVNQDRLGWGAGIRRNPALSPRGLMPSIALRAILRAAVPRFNTRCARRRTFKPLRSIIGAAGNPTSTGSPVEGFSSLMFAGDAAFRDRRILDMLNSLSNMRYYWWVNVTLD